jgi:undecaprenyl pyrophosphate synthase
MTPTPATKILVKDTATKDSEPSFMKEVHVCVVRHAERTFSRHITETGKNNTRKRALWFKSIGCSRVCYFGFGTAPFETARLYAEELETVAEKGFPSKITGWGPILFVTSHSLCNLLYYAKDWWSSKDFDRVHYILANGKILRGIISPPYHVALIPDGNRRLAALKRLPTNKAHAFGKVLCAKFVEHMLSIGVRELSLYAWSRDNNQKRTSDERDVVFNLLNDSWAQFKGVRIRVVYDDEGLEEHMIDKFKEINNITCEGYTSTIYIYVNYDNRSEIRSVGIDGLHLLPRPISNPDLLIRTGYRNSLSDFLTYQCAHTELHFVNGYLNILSDNYVYKVLLDYVRMNRKDKGK